MITIIIPTFNEAAIIEKLLCYLQLHGAKHIAEIIVVDSGSDETFNIAKNLGVVAVRTATKGRAAQMNQGEALATGSILYFVHADTLPPKSFAIDIELAIKNVYGFGRFCTEFDSKSTLLKVNAVFTKLDLFVCYGGDQTLFITQNLFGEIGGYNANLKVMEDYDITTRAKQKAKYKIIKKNVLVSARKYEKNNWWQVQKANYIIVKMYKNRANQQEIIAKYKSLLITNSY